MIILELQTLRWDVACAISWLHRYHRRPAHQGGSYFWCYGHGSGLGWISDWKTDSSWLPLELAEHLPAGNRRPQEWRTFVDATNAVLIALVRFRLEHNRDPD